MSTNKRRRGPIKERGTGELVYLLQEAAWLFGNKAFDGTCCQGLSYLEYQALAELKRVGTCTVQEVGAAVRFTKSGATRIIDRLESKGLVLRRRSPDDGRVCCVSITSAGKIVTSKIMANYAAYLKDVLKNLDVGSVEMIAGSLRSLIAAAR
jgi:DNA-binding MarR family transcriptional regulator